MAEKAALDAEESRWKARKEVCLIFSLKTQTTRRDRDESMSLEMVRVKLL